MMYKTYETDICCDRYDVDITNWTIASYVYVL
jgi:hypothetical protein